MEVFAKNLRELRLRYNESQEELANVIKTHQTTIGLWERNQREPTAPFIVALARHFDVSADYLLGLED